jgi:hypothetical protein
VAAEPDFDLVAASLRAETSDMRAFVEALAVKLEQALPQETRVDRRSKKFLSREKVVRKIDVGVGDNRYVLIVDDRGNPDARRATAVRGIVLKSEELDVNSWIDGLARDLTEHATATEQGRIALERLLI